MRTEYKDGWLTIREENTWSNEPVRLITWWPVVQESRATLDAMDLLDKEVTYGGDGVYSVRIAPYQYKTAVLANGGQTKPLAIEKQAIPMPKVRKGVEVRYRNGQWQKYLKSGGWITI